MCAREISQPKYEIVGKLERFNEADNVQARGELLPDSRLWKDYYEKHPELENLGRAWSKLPGPGDTGPLEDRLMVAAMHDTLSLLSKDEDLDGIPSPSKSIIHPSRASEKIKGLARHLGADLVRVGPLNRAWVYSHVGRAYYPGKEIGAEINLPHDSAIIVATHLKLSKLRCAPELGSLTEIFQNYLQLAKIVVTLAKYIRL
ncbi:MAG TPA: hypothetical protein VF318_02300, partial [Dehalococcoidales bacterium]